MGEPFSPAAWWALSEEERQRRVSALAAENPDYRVSYDPETGFAVIDGGLLVTSTFSTSARKDD